MKQVLGCVFTNELNDLIVAHLSARTDVSIALKTDLNEATQLIQLLGEVDVFIMEDDLTGKFYNGIPKNLPAKTLVIGIGDPQHESAPKHCFRAQEWEKVLTLINEKFGSEESSAIQYVSMPINLFSHFDTINVDVFLQMTKDGKPHWVRRFLAGESIEASDIATY